MNSFFCEHLLGSFFKIRSSLIIKLLFCESCPTLSLCILSGRLLKSSWCLLHPHHGPWISSLAGACCVQSCHSSIVSIWISNVHSAFFWYYWVLLGCILVSNDLWLFSYYVQHAIFQSFFIFAQTILLPSVVQHFWIEVVSFQTFIEKSNA